VLRLGHATATQRARAGRRQLLLLPLLLLLLLAPLLELGGRGDGRQGRRQIVLRERVCAAA
jgi:hypothetical protein